LRGEIVWLLAYDVAFELKKDAVAAALAERGPRYRKAGRYRRAPGGVMLFSPLVVELPECELPGLPGRLVRPTAKFFSAGALSISLRVDFDARSLDDLMPFRAMADAEGEGPHLLARQLAEELVEMARPGLVRPCASWDRCEDYTVVCITESEGLEDGTMRWLEARRAQVAALLLGEGPAEELSEQQVEESLRHAYSFGKTDLAVVEWDGMLVVETRTSYEELLYVAEAANVQLVEMRAHDEVLDKAIDRAYEDLDHYYDRPALFREPARLAHSLREQKIDLARIADQIYNVSKFFGDWHLARIYEALELRFHLAEWQDQLEEKLRTVDSLYQIIAKEKTDRSMFVLELAIVVLFVLDLLIILIHG